MIDFQNGSVFKLQQKEPQSGHATVAPLLLDGETVVATYAGKRDSIVFTSKRIIAVNVQGLTGAKVDYSSLPYSRIQAFSVETAGAFDRDSELEMWFSGLGKVKLEFGGSVDIKWIGQWIGYQSMQ